MGKKLVKEKKMKPKTKEQLLARWDQRQLGQRNVIQVRHRLAFSEENIGEVNEMRKLLNMSLVTFKNRNCLRCDTIFESKGPNHRMCWGCHDKYY